MPDEAAAGAELDVVASVVDGADSVAVLVVAAGTESVSALALVDPFLEAFFPFFFGGCVDLG